MLSLLNLCAPKFSSSVPENVMKLLKLIFIIPISAGRATWYHLWGADKGASGTGEEWKSTWESR